MKRLIRNGHIGVAVGGSLAVLAAIIFHGDEGLLELSALVALAATMGVFLALNARDDRTRSREREDRP